MGDRSHAQALYNQGVDAAKNTQYPTHLQHAYKCFVSACYADPTWWQAWYQAGNNNADQKLATSAIGCYRRALQCDCTDLDRAKVLCNLAWNLEEVGEVDESFELAKQAIALDPNFKQAHINLSICYRDMGDAKMALQHAQIAFGLDPSDISSEINLAFAYLFDRQFAKGLKHLEKRFQWRLHNFLNYPYPQWHGEKDKIVLLVADQGLGDTLSYARFVRQACQRAKYVHAVVQHELLRLFQHAFVDIPNLNLLPGLNQNFPSADAWTTFVSLPNALGLTDDEIRNTPQIQSPVYPLPKTWKVPDRKLHIGIAWAGSPLNDIDRHRNIPMLEFLALYRVPGIQLYSLQVGDRGKEMHDSGSAALVQDLAPYIHDVVDTVSLLQELDLVISVESALGHICALAGKECWIPYSYFGRDYRIGLDGKDMLWTPRHRVFLQEKNRLWAPVFEQITAALCERLSSGLNAGQQKPNG